MMAAPEPPAAIARIGGVLAEQGLPAPHDAAEKLLRYAELLLHWNRRVNLVACHRLEELLERHLLDALSLGPHLVGDELLDAGSGAGLPGIPLAITQPQRTFHLVDSNAKKTAFLYAAVAGLALPNVMIHNCRLRDLTGDVQPDCLVSRAFGPLPELLAECEPVLPPGGRLLLMKGRRYQEELADLPASFRLIGVQDLVPGGASDRGFLVELSKVGPSP